MKKTLALILIQQLLLQMGLGSGIKLRAYAKIDQERPPIEQREIAPRVVTTLSPTPTPIPQKIKDTDEKETIYTSRMDFTRPNKCLSLTQDINNGISVTEIKPYDERNLRSQLQLYEESLARTQYPELSGLYGNVNYFQGSESRSTSLVGSISTLPQPAISTTSGNTSGSTQSESNTTGTSVTDVRTDGTTGTNNGTTVTTVTNNGATVTTVNTANNTSGNTLTSGTSYSQTVNQAAANPNIPTTQLGTTTLPGAINFGVSPQDTLDKYTALTYQIFNLRSLLNQSYSDRIISEGEEFKTRSQAYIGFTVNIEPKFENHVAEVEITIFNDRSDDSKKADPKPDQKLAVINLFPEEKTYNVAKITDDKKSLGAGAIVSILNVGAAYGKSTNKLYLAKDTDTVAFQRDQPTVEYDKDSSGFYFVSKKGVTKYRERDPDKDPTGNVTEVRKTRESTTFVWQFRPVLGQKTVTPGVRKVFALIAIPKEESSDKNWEGSFQINTQWKSLSRGGITEEKVGWIDRARISLTGGKIGSKLYTACGGNLLIPSSKKVDSALKPKIDNATWTDNANGQVTVIADGRNFTKDTQILFGDLVIDQSKKNLSIIGEQRLIFTVPAKNILKFPPTVINKYGNTKLEILEIRDSLYQNLEGPEITIPDNPGPNTLVEISIKPLDVNKCKPDFNNCNIFKSDKLSPIVEIESTIFGLADSPFSNKSYNEKTGTTTFSITVPKKILKEKGELRVRNLFNGKESVLVKYKTAVFSVPFSVISVQKLPNDSDETNQKTFPILVIGSGLNEKTKVVAAGTSQVCDQNANSMCLLQVSKNTKKIFISHNGGDVIAIDLDNPNPFPTASISTLPSEISIKKGDSKTIVLKGANLESIKSIFFENITLSFKLSEDKLSLELFIPLALTSSSGQKELTLTMKDDKRTNYTITIP